MKLLDFLALICVTLYLLPLRVVSVLTERLLKVRRDGAWETSLRDQFALSLAHAGALRQANLYSAYPGPARLVVDGLRLIGVR